MDFYVDCGNIAGLSNHQAMSVMKQMNSSNQTSFEAKRLFRYHSRCVLKQPYSKYDHKQRIEIAKSFVENEPLQGAIADYIFMYWYELSVQEQDFFADIEYRFKADTLAKFKRCIAQQDYIQSISELATRWSVLLTPSSDVPVHQQRINSEDSLVLANHISQQLLQAREEGNSELLELLEDEFISHCMACMDRIAFLTVWMKLSKKDWNFTSKWRNCHQTLQC